VCGTKLERIAGEAAFYCKNITGCAPQITGRIEHFIHRKAMDIDSLGEKTIEQLHKLGLVHSPADLYDLTIKDALQLEGFKEKSAKNLIEGINRSKLTAFENVLFAIGIRYVGKTVAEKLARYFKNIDKIAAASKEELLAVYVKNCFFSHLHISSCRSDAAHHALASNQVHVWTRKVFSTITNRFSGYLAHSARP